MPFWPTGLVGPPWEFSLALAYLLLVLAGQGVPVLLAYRMPRLPEAGAGDPGSLPSLSVILPARNEEDAIGACLDSLAAQDYRSSGGSLEVIVVDGGSSDRTRELARAHPIGATVLDEPPLPAGWVGKNWACHQGYLRSRGEYLLFLDSDLVLAPPVLRRAVDQARAERTCLLSLASRIVMRGFWERVVMPLFTQFVLVYFVAPRANVDTSHRAMANGQFMLFTRGGYESVGGHAAIRGTILEDVHLAQRVKGQGQRLRVYWTPDWVTTRMYADRKEMREGLLKNLHGTRFSALRQLGLASLVALFFLSPFAILVASLVGALPAIWGIFSTALVAITALKQVGFQRTLEGRGSGAFGLLYPLGALFYLGLFASSLARGLGGREVTWKGRHYPLDPGVGGEAPTPEPPGPGKR
ncbi:glycosyl transferase domain protein, group 2 family protein [mine drainage metagenome]|uniref:Glycosyl transferase domain protein, group 2 family protein n=1 Tax=mine drainage metagenome TaxID=410659 RepID=T1BCP0_9ZZZZ